LYRSVGWVSGCALLTIAVIACICIFVAALPLFPVLLAATVLGAASAAVCIWSICRLKKLDGESKKQQTSSEPPEEGKPPVETPEGENLQTLVSGIHGPETNFEGEQPVIGTSKSKEILDDTGPSSEPPSSGEESPQPPADPIGFQESADKPEPPTKPQGLPGKPDGEEPGNAQSDILRSGTNSAGILVQSGPIPPHNSVQKFSEHSSDALEILGETHAAGGESQQLPANPIETQDLLQSTMVNQNSDTLEQGINGNAAAVKMRTAMDVNDPKVDGQLRAAQVLYFLGMEDNKFLFECARSTHYSEPKIRFSADNIESVWGKSINVKSLYFPGKLPENFQISGDKLKNLKGIHFSSNKIRKFEASKHLAGTFNGLTGITFRNCSKLHSARISGNCIAKNFRDVQFNNCPILDDFCVGNESQHIHPGNRLFGSKNRVLVRLEGCQNLSVKQKHLNGIVADDKEIRLNKEGELSHGIYSIASCALERESNLQRANGISTIDLQFPDVSALDVMLYYETLDPHVVVDFNLNSCERVVFPMKRTAMIEHLEFTKPTANCYVEFYANPGKTLLDVNGFPQNSTDGTGKPFKMFFGTTEPTELPAVRINNVTLTDIKWYQSKNQNRPHTLIPVIRENWEKADRQTGWTAVEMARSSWVYNQAVELNSDFLFAEQPRIEVNETSEPKVIPDELEPSNEPHADGKEPPAESGESLYQQTDQMGILESADKSNSSIELQGSSENANGEESKNTQSNVSNSNVSTSITSVRSGLLPSGGGVSRFSAPPAGAAKTEAVMDINNPKIAEQLSTAQVLHFCGMEDDKFLFECSQTTDKSEPKICFFADNTEDVWEKLESVKLFCFSGEFPEDFQIQGDRLKKLESVIFSSAKIKNFEAAKHLTGTFEGLQSIIFLECINLQSARISGECIAPKFCSVIFKDCPILDDVHIGDHPNDEEIIKKIHLHKSEECLFGKTGELVVQLYDCQKFSERQTDFDNIAMHAHEIYGYKVNPEALSKGNRADTYFAVYRTFSRESALSKESNISTVNLQLPGIASRSIRLNDETLDSHVIVNFNLAKCGKIVIPDNTRIDHLEIAEPMDDCRVEFAAHENGTLLEINGLPQNSIDGTGKPFKMSFWSSGNSALPKIKLRGTILENIQWYKHQLPHGSVQCIIPVIQENLEKAKKQPGWVPIQWEGTYGKAVELNSDFLFV
jgi:hypothetical protein